MQTIRSLIRRLLEWIGIAERQADDGLETQRLYFKTYLQMIHNSLDSRLFRNFYVFTKQRGEFDALGDGSDSCAFFVSSLLVIFRTISDVHGTVEGVMPDLEESGWQLLSDQAPQAGDVLVWEPRDFNSQPQTHIGFSIGGGRAVSASYKTQTPVEHDETFGPEQRAITHIYRFVHWDEESGSGRRQR